MMYCLFLIGITILTTNENLGKDMHWVKVIHVLCVFIWVGNLITLSRLLGYHVKEEVETQEKIVKWYKRMYYFIDIPFMLLSIVLGLFLLMQTQFSQHPVWFTVKLFFIMGIIACDMLVGNQVSRLQREFKKSKGIQFKILHGVIGLLFLGVIISLYVIRDQKEELRVQVLAELEAVRSDVLLKEKSL